MYNFLRTFHAVAVICELNPPHGGHLALFRKIRAITDAPIVAVMSGNFVQRGEPAIFPKRDRALAALRLGAELVIELPVGFALSSAERFALGGVALADAIGADALAFGCECGELEPLARIADVLDSRDAETLTREYIAAGESFAAARSHAVETLLGDGAEPIRGTNNMLAVEYLRAIRRCGGGITPIALPREPDVSSSAIRERIKRGGETDIAVPPVFPENLDVAVLSRLRNMDIGELRLVPNSGDGATERLMRAAATAGSLTELENAVKTKRYTMSRVRRLILGAAIGLRQVETPPYVRALAISGRGAALLRDSTLPVVTKPTAARKLGGVVADSIETESRATDLYALGYADTTMRRGGSEWRYTPIVE
ncbi:MAG: nucleotidyltransferase family protein [Oscillospiraceae bacterium]|jgi:predicted nucleotidyltransferase|nr:nucleotidyltransferase family protein [Oscillospiraceae bacterium]